MREHNDTEVWNEPLSDEEEDKDEDRGLNPNSAEAIRKRLQRFQRRCPTSRAMKNRES